MSWLLIASLFQANVYFTSDNLYARLKNRIDLAQSSIDICFYDIDSSYITTALINARNERGVKVRVITEDERLDRPWLWRLRLAGVQVWTDSIGPGRGSLMHNKFAIFDYRDSIPANDWLWTGSFNVGAGSYNADNAVEVQDSGLAHAYTTEFEQMWGGSDSLPNPAQAEFHGGKTDRLARHRYVVGADTFLVYFSPQDHPVDTLARLAGQARSELGFCIYSYTYRALALSMKDRAGHGVWVGGVFDRSESTASASYFDTLRLWGIPVYTDKFMGPGNLLHEKIMVIDQKLAATGSVNWSNAGNNSNDENSLLCFSPTIASRYRSEISQRFNEAGGTYAQNDVAVTGIQSPAGMIDSSSAVTPVTLVRNNGSMVASFKTFFRIRDSSGTSLFLDSVMVVGLLPGATRAVSYSSWPGPRAIGRYSARCSSWVYGETGPSDNILDNSFQAVAIWLARADVPSGLKSKRVRSGAGLACWQSGDTSFVYALKGNRCNEFYRYQTQLDRWESLAPMPFIHRSGRLGFVGKGGAIAAGPGALFALKGGSSLELWRYAADSVLPGWSELASMPGSSGRVRSGSGITAVQDADTCFLFATKGGRSQSFYRYCVPADRWDWIDSLPAGSKSRKFGIGSGMTSDGDSLVYLLKGRASEFYSFDLTDRSWKTLSPLPLVGRAGLARKARAGAALAYANGRVYALKGGKSNELWAYDCALDTWLQMTDIPGQVRIGEGGAIAYDRSSNALYLLQGNNTLGLWRYQLTSDGPPAGPLTPGNTATQSLNPASPCSLCIAPNPSADRATISYSLRQESNVSIKLYDVMGKLVITMVSGRQCAGKHSFLFRIPQSAFRIAEGVYLLKFEAEGYQTTKKLILE